MIPPHEQRPPALDAAPEEARAALEALRDSLRSARHWRDLLSEDGRRRMLADIAAVALAAGRDLHPNTGLSDLDVGDPAPGAPAPSAPCPRERLAFLEALWPRLSGALRRVEAAPPAALTRERRPVPAALARRSPSPAAVMAALRTGDLVPTPRGPLLPRRLSEERALSTHATPENRAVKTVLVAWARDLAAVAGLAEVCGEPGVADRARRLRARLRSAHLCREPWRDLAPLPAVPPPTPAALRDGSYRLIWDAWRRYRRGFAFDWSSSPLFTLPARETWRLYEVWCFLSVAGALRDLGWRCTDADELSLLRGGLSFSLAPGAASRMTFVRGTERATLTYARRFPRAGEPPARDGWRSRSHALTPDMTLRYNDTLLVLDAKFKTYAAGAGAAGRFDEGALFPDLQQMHTYRDALLRGDGAPGVAGAWLLYCGPAAGCSPEVVAYPAATAARPLGDGLLGAVRLRPGGGRGPLRVLLAGFLGQVH